jgi:hypothetical protein
MRLRAGGSVPSPGPLPGVLVDPEREFEYTSGAETSLERAADDGWTVVSIKHDWATVFADAS